MPPLQLHVYKYNFTNNFTKPKESRHFLWIPGNAGVHVTSSTKERDCETVSTPGRLAQPSLIVACQNWHCYSFVRAANFRLRKIQKTPPKVTQLFSAEQGPEPGSVIRVSHVLQLPAPPLPLRIWRMVIVSADHLGSLVMIKRLSPSRSRMIRTRQVLMPFSASSGNF